VASGYPKKKQFVNPLHGLKVTTILLIQENSSVFLKHPIEKKFRKNLENPLIYRVFCFQGEKIKNFENIFFDLKPLYLGQILTD